MRLLPKIPKKKSKSVWLLESIENGLKSTLVEDSKKGFIHQKNVDSVFFENDYLFGKGVFEEKGIRSVSQIFEELNKNFPENLGYIFEPYNFLRKTGGIQRQHRITHDESFYSYETLRNRSAATFLELSDKNIDESNDQERRKTAISSNESGNEQNLLQ